VSRLIVKDGRLCIVGGRLVTSEGGAPCVCDEPPIGESCWVQLIPCVCPTPATVRWASRGLLVAADGILHPVYRFGSTCYRVGGSYAGDRPDGTVLTQYPDAFYDDCSDAACGEPPPFGGCPCPPGTVQFTYATCNADARYYCTRYLLTRVNWRLTLDVTNRFSCSPGSYRTARRTSTRSAEGWAVLDLVTGTVVSSRVTVSIVGTAEVQIPGSPTCALRTVSINYLRTLTEADTGLFGAPLWFNYDGNGSPAGTFHQPTFTHGPIVPVSGDVTDPDEQTAENLTNTAVYGAACASGSANTANGTLTWDHLFGESVVVTSATETRSRTGPTGDTGTLTSEYTARWFFVDTANPDVDALLEECPEAALAIACDDPADRATVATAGLDPLPFGVLLPRPDGLRCYRLTSLIGPGDPEVPVGTFDGCDDPACLPPPPSGQFRVATRCRDTGVAAGYPKTVVVEINPNIPPSNSSVILTDFTPNALCPASAICTTVVHYRLTETEDPGPATPRAVIVAGSPCGSNDSRVCQSCPQQGEGGRPVTRPVAESPGMTEGDRMLAAMGFDPEEERRKLLNGGDCGCSPQAGFYG
jgi:hypothetical protein